MEAVNSDESESAWCEDRDVTQETQAKVEHGRPDTKDVIEF